LKEAAEKVISLPRERSSRTFGTDELNICEFPLYSTGRGNSPHENTLVFEDRIFDEGTQEPVHRKLMVSASEAFGLPTPADSDVLLVLMHFTNQRNGFTDRTVHFTRYELVNALGWDHSGKSYRRIEESLQRWVNITLNYNRAWWDRDCRRWQNKSFHILESVDLRGRGDSLDDGTSSFTWNQVIFGSFQANHVKRLDLDTYLKLKSPAARQAYRFLDKRFYRTKFLEFDLTNFACEHIGLSRSYDNGQLKRKLQPAIEELEEIGFLKRLPLAERYLKRRRGEWLIRLIRESEAAETATPAVEIDDAKPLVAELTSRGLHASTARELAAEFSEERIREKISLLDWLTAKGGERAPKNPAGYLAAAIRNDYRPPGDFNSLPTNAKGDRVKRERLRICTPDSDLEERRLDQARKYFQSLPAEERQSIEALAVKNGNRFRVDTYQRLKESGGALWEEVRDLLIADALDHSSN
jgi:hypothetical protein